MRMLHRRVAGLDVHKKSISACVRIRPAGSSKTEVHSALFGTFSAELERLRSWLCEHKVRQVALESTGVYWVPVWNVLERGKRKPELVLINPQHVRALPGRKTDQQDCERIAELLQYGLLRSSFVPPRPIRQLRDLTRRRAHLQQDRNRVINRIGRLLETANCKLSSVVSNIVGKTGTMILKALARGASDPSQLAEMAQGSLQLKKADLVQALTGRYSEHFRWLLGELLSELEQLDGKLERMDRRISQEAATHTDLIRRLCTIPTVQLTTALTLLAELGPDMSQFADSSHASSWAGLCPGNNESAGKKHSGRTRKGNVYLRRTLIQNAWAVSHMKDCYLTGVFFRIAGRRGMKKAAVAIAHKILVIAYHIIRDGETYHEIGGDFHDRLHPERTVNRLARRIENLGYQVNLTEPIATAPDQSKSAPNKKKRGRPCLCQKRGIICIHAT